MCTFPEPLAGANVIIPVPGLTPLTSRLLNTKEDFIARRQERREPEGCRTGAWPELQWGMFYGRSGEDLRVQMDGAGISQPPPSGWSGLEEPHGRGSSSTL